MPLLLLAALLLPVAGHAAPAAEISNLVKFTVSTGSVKGAMDELIATAWSPITKNATISMEFPAEGAGYVRLDWDFDSPGYAFIQYDWDHNEIVSRTEKDSYAGITHLFPIADGARFATLKLTSAGQKICKVRVYAKGELPDDVPNFDPPCDKCDLMIVCAHQGDEFLCFGGIVPYYSGVMGKRVEVVYMADCGRLRRDEALNGLWAVGVRNYPDFLNLRDMRVKSIKEGVALWGGKDTILSKLVERIRRYRPEVILTHDLDGEYGENQHKIAANAMRMAIEAAADPAQYPDSCAAYGAWQVKKLYLHLYSQGVIDFDWNVPSAQLEGKTPLEAARAGYAKHISQQTEYQVLDGGSYDNSLFGLAYSAVGQDAKHDDLFENIAAEKTAEPTVSLSSEPTVPATPAPPAGGKAGINDERIGLVVLSGIALLILLWIVRTITFTRKREK